MSVTAADLTKKHCVSCDGNTKPLSPADARALLAAIPDWKLTADGRGIRREWRVKDFPTALDFFYRLGQIAEAEDHHPDLHLANYREVAIDLWTHAANGLTENDFIMAAKIDELKVELKK
jgi:4a-hydroxytetrahydrobiopterin dehydratase